MAKFFAAYDDLCIMSVADTAEQALAAAHELAGNFREFHFEVSEIEAGFAAEILRDGFNPSDSFRHENGVLVRWED